MRHSTRELFEKYGPVAITTYFAIFFLTLFAFFWAIRMGWKTTSVTGTAGTLGAAYVATKLTQPLRIGATLLLTPLLAALRDRLRAKGRVDEKSEGTGARP